MAKFFLFDESMQSAKAKITTAKLATMGDIVANEKAFIYAEGEDAPDEITVMGNVLVAVGNSIFKTVETTLTAANLDSGSAFTVGTDYNIFVCDPTNGDETVDQNEAFVISVSTTYPVGYTAANSRRIGGFHYGVVRKIDDNGEPVNASGTTRGSGWESNVYNGILPNSVWTLLHRPKCDPAGMVYIGNGLWGDIYLSSDDNNGGLNTARTKTGNVTYAVSSMNIRDLVGNVWKWVDEFCLDPTATTWAWQDVLGSGHGQAYIPSATALHALICGGGWGNGVHDGDRAVGCSNYPWYVGTSLGVWCVCDSQ